jgi:glucose/arabinose dehydrogenase
MTLDPDFDRTHFLYLVYTAASRSGLPAFRLARFREVDGTLGERAVLLEDLPATLTSAAASLRFGPDGKLYVAFGAGPDTRRTGNLAFYDGKVLRLNRDGSTPLDQPMATPVYAAGYSTPRGLDWQPSTGALWLAGHDLDGIGRLSAFASGGGASIRPGNASSFALPQSVTPSAATFYRSERIPWLRGDLLVAGGDAQTVTRIRFDSVDPGRISSIETLVDHAGGSIRTLAVSPDGNIYALVNGDVLRFIVPAVP